MATNKIVLDEGTTTNTATYSGTEDAVTKHVGRIVLNNSSLTEVGTIANPIQVNLTALPSNSTTPIGKFIPFDGTNNLGDSPARPMYVLATLATLPVVTGPSLVAGGSLTAYQGGIWTAQPGNTPNTIAWLVTFATIPVVTSISALNQGNSGSQAWLTTLATLPVVANINNASIPVTQSGTWTVQPGNTPNTIGWLITQATLPVNVGSPSVLAAGGSLSSYQGGVWNVFSSLASGTNMVAGGQFLPSLTSLTSQGFTNLGVDLFGNLRVNNYVSLPNITRINQNYSSFASNASLIAAPGAGKRLVIRELDFSCDATMTMKIMEDQGGTPIVRFGPHYFPPNGGMVKPECYIPFTSNKSLGITTVGAGNATIDLRIETEAV